MLTRLNPFDSNQPFPDVNQALEEPNGLLAVGGCLSTSRMENAYRRGIFPWYGEGEPILWWSPDPRLILYPDHLKVSHSLRKTFRKGAFEFSHDRCFDAVVEACAGPRIDSAGTWILPEMKRAYAELHFRGMAHSFEAWQDGALVGGLYGVSIGRVFFGESMFYRASNASKAAFVFAVDCLKKWGYALIDCQVSTEHLSSLGAQQIARAEFVRLLERYCALPVEPDAWRLDGSG